MSRPRRHSGSTNYLLGLGFGAGCGLLGGGEGFLPRSIIFSLEAPLDEKFIVQPYFLGADGVDGLDGGFAGGGGGWRRRVALITFWFRQGHW